MLLARLVITCPLVLRVLILLLGLGLVLRRPISSHMRGVEAISEGYVEGGEDGRL